MAEVMDDDYKEILNQAYLRMQDVSKGFGQVQEKPGALPEITLPKNYRQIMPQTSIITKGYTEAIQPLAAAQQRAETDIGPLKTTYETQLAEISQKLKDYEKSAAKTEIPERSDAADLMMALAPAFGGILFGESGALAGPAAAERAKSSYDTAIKENIQRLKDMREKQSAKAKLGIEKGIEIAKLAQTGLKEKEDISQKLGQEISRAKQGASKEMADIETRALEKAQKQTEKPEQLPPHVKSYAQALGTKLSYTDAVTSTLQKMSEIARDNSKSTEERVAAVRSLVKNINSTLGPDALSNAEFERAAPYLDYAPNAIKKMPGYDLQGFATQMDNLVNIQQGNKATLLQNINQMYEQSGSRFAQQPSQQQEVTGQQRQQKPPPKTPKVPMTRQEKIDFLRGK